MCDLDNWRSLGNVVAEVTELALLDSIARQDGTGWPSAHLFNVPPPPQRDRAAIPSRVGIDGGRLNGEGIVRPPMRTEAWSPPAQTEFEWPAGRARTGWPLVAAESRFRRHGIPDTGMEIVRVYAQPHAEPLGSALAISMPAHFSTRTTPVTGPAVSKESCQ